MAGKGLAVGRTHGNGMGATPAGGVMSRGVASEFDRSMNKASYVDDTPVPVIVMDCEYNIEYVNGAAALLVGSAAEACVGLKLWDLFDNEAIRNGKGLAGCAIREGHSMSGDAECVVKGRKMAIRAFAAPRFDEHNQVIGVVQVMEDNSEEARAAGEISRLVKASLDGQLRERAKSEDFQGNYRDLLAEINAMLDAVIGPLNVAAGYVDRISKGDIPPKITDNYNGDFNTIKNNLNQCIDEMGALREATSVTKRMADNDYSKGVDGKYEGIFGELAVGINGAQDRVRHATSIVKNISRGNLEDLAVLKKVGARSENDEFIPSFIALMTNLVALADDAEMLTKAAVEGRLETRADASKHQGEFRKIVQGVNDTLDAVIGPLNFSAGYVDRISKGDIPPKITDNYNGDFNTIKINLNRCIDAVGAMIADTAMLSKAAVEGRLETRADVAKHQGDYRKIVQGVNDTLDAVIGPLQLLRRLCGPDLQG